MFWQNKKKVRFFDECRAILDFLRKWLLNQFPSVFNQNLQYASDVHQYSSRYEKKINFYTPYYTTNLREKNYVCHDSEH